MTMMMDLANDAHDFDFEDVLIADDCEDTWANREYAGALSLILGAYADGKDPAGLNQLLGRHLGMQVNHTQPHGKCRS